MKAALLTPDRTVAEVVQEYPKTMHVWLAFKTDCFGCYLMKFCSLDYVAKSYHIKVNTLIEELEKTILND